ncbi:hypothetical protein HNR77_004233 [Paenibacillus sp. JGP012]|nr:hypothetical protein [Paenibacillus sp. JGP012]
MKPNKQPSSLKNIGNGHQPNKSQEQMPKPPSGGSSVEKK